MLVVATTLLYVFNQDKTKPEKTTVSPLKQIQSKETAKRATVIPDVPERKVWRPSTKPNRTARLTPPARKTKEVFEFASLPSNCLLKASIFRRQSDGMIAGILTAIPGDHFICDDWDNGFDEDFRKSLDEKIEISPTDSDEDRALKEAVMSAREMLAGYMAKGEKPSQILREAQQEIERITEYRDQLNEEMESFLDKMDVENALAYCDEANKILQEYNAPPLTVSERKIKKILRLREAGAGK